jgi:FMN phosphatase YigB (HAD superfamily)
MKKLLITDLDNTLYDWVAFFSQSFNAMLMKTHNITGIDIETLTKDFKAVHQFHGNTEQPFSILELRSIREHFGTDNKKSLLLEVDEALHSFNSTRKKTLKCYEGVVETLDYLVTKGVLIVGHTEAPVRNSLYRLEKLGIKKYFSHLYTPKEKYHDDLDYKTLCWLEDHENFLRLLTKEELKPNPELLLDICEREGIDSQDAIYVGDSIVKDISMANDAGITSVWAEYGKQHTAEYWSTLVSITHWTDEDVKKEESLKEALGRSKPSVTISKFSQLKALFG